VSDTTVSTSVLLISNERMEKEINANPTGSKRKKISVIFHIRSKNILQHIVKFVTRVSAYSIFDCFKITNAKLNKVVGGTISNELSEHSAFIICPKITLRILTI